MENHGRREVRAEADSGLEVQNRYSIISYEVFPNTIKERKRLVSLVFEEGISIYRASKMLKINNSTAKAIVRNFRNKGIIFKRRHEQIEG
jgi:ribosomal protein S25